MVSSSGLMSESNDLESMEGYERGCGAISLYQIQPPALRRKGIHGAGAGGIACSVKPAW
jgi:hypothetical protein